MVPFFVQIKCKLGESYAVANALAEAEIASEIYSTAGHYDLLVKFYVANDTDIGHFVNEKVQVIPGIQDTHTIITFKAVGTPYPCSWHPSPGLVAAFSPCPAAAGHPPAAAILDNSPSQRDPQ